MNKITKRTQLILVIIILIYGIYLIDKGNYQYECRKEGPTLKDIPINDLQIDNYVSFYMDDYVKKKTLTSTGFEYSGVSQEYTDGNITYAVYTVLGAENYYFQIMVNNQDTLKRLEHIDAGPIYFEGVVVDELFEMNKEWYEGIEENIAPHFDNIISNIVIKEMEIPPVDHSRDIGIICVVLSVIGYFIIGGIKACMPKVTSDTNDMESYFSYNIKAEYELEQENLLSLLKEQEGIKKTFIIWIVFLVVAIVLFWKLPFVFKMLGLIPLIISAIGFWNYFINSDMKAAVYIAKVHEIRSVHLEVLNSRKNIEKYREAISAFDSSYRDGKTKV